MLKIIVGCYEQMLLGYVVNKAEDEETEKFKAELKFTDHSHTASVKTLACGGPYLASGASDETIFLFDLKLNKEVGSLQGHEGTITHLSFPDNKFLISSSDDGSMNVWKVATNWKKVKSLRGHKGPVSYFDVHPSGKLALSASPKDGTLRTWNMISGRAVYVKNMKKFSPEIVQFSPENGEFYLIASTKCVQIYNLGSAECVSEISLKNTILAAEFINKDLVAVAGQGDEIYIFKASTGNCLVKFEAHTSRVKALHTIHPPQTFVDVEAGIHPLWLGSASSDGHVKIWSLDTEKLISDEAQVLKAPICLLDIDTKARLTCLTSWCEET